MTVVVCVNVCDAFTLCFSHWCHSLTCIICIKRMLIAFQKHYVFESNIHMICGAIFVCLMQQLLMVVTRLNLSQQDILSCLIWRKNVIYGRSVPRSDYFCVERCSKTNKLESELTWQIPFIYNVFDVKCVVAIECVYSMFIM